MRTLSALTLGLSLLVSSTLSAGATDGLPPATERAPGTERVAPRLGNVFAPNQVGYGRVSPRRFYAGGSATGDVYNVTWSNWGRRRASARGTANWIPPGGYGYQARPVAARIRAYNLGNCNGRRAYRSVRWWFPSKGETAHTRPRHGFPDICRDGQGTY